MGHAQEFLALHQPGSPLLLANAWDAGSAKLLAHVGFKALATTSSGHAATFGRTDGNVSRGEAIAHARDLVAATDLPVSADLENGFGPDASTVAETIRLAIDAGLAGASIEDSTGQDDADIFELAHATERVAAAVEAAGADIVITARAENYLHGRRDLDDTIARLVAYADAGAHVVYAPGIASAEEIRAVVEAVDVPVNVLMAVPGVPPVAELASLGVARVSVGGAFAFAALGAVAEAGRELLEDGTYGWLAGAGAGSKAAQGAFSA